MNLERLERVVTYLESKPPPEDPDDWLEYEAAIALSAQAGRAVLSAPTIPWCKTHETSPSIRRQDCDIVTVALVPVEE